MVRVALVQWLYKPALIDSGIDYLAEPALSQKTACLASLSESVGEEQDGPQILQNQIRDNYITYLEQKLNVLCKNLQKLYSPDILVFPEYSIPFQCLPGMARLARDLHLTIIAGSHTVLPSAKDYYMQAGLPADEILKTYVNGSVAPIFFPNAPADYQCKHTRSIFEMTMKEVEDVHFKRFHSCTKSGEPFCFSVIICADALQTDIAGHLDLAESDSEHPMVFIPACSTSTTGFDSLSQIHALKSTPTFICNTSRYGGTGIFLTESVKQRFVNLPDQASHLGQGLEAVMLCTLNPNQFYVKRGILDNESLGYWTVSPILYAEKEEWVREYQKTIRSIQEALDQNDAEEAETAIDGFMLMYEDQIPDQLSSAIQHFIQRLGTFSGQTDSYVDMLKIVVLNIYSMQEQFAMELKDAIDLCVTIGLGAMSCLASFFQQRKQYPKPDVQRIQSVMPEAISRPQPTAEENDAFRDRGAYLTHLQETMTNPNVKMILLSGAYGIGKTSLIQMVFKRHLPDWDVKSVSLTTPIRFSMLLEYMASLIGCTLHADTLLRSSMRALKPTMDSFVKKLLAKRGRVIVVDHMEMTLREQQGRDFNLMFMFRDSVQRMTTGEGKIIFISDIRFSKDAFPDHPFIERIVMGKIAENKHIKRILEYEMRKRKMIAPTDIPEISDDIYELINGHPLTAKLCVEVMYLHGPEPLNSISREQLQSQIIQQLMEKMYLPKIESDLLQLLSVFRTVIQIPLLKKHLTPQLNELLDEKLKELENIPFISRGESTLEITSVFRNYYYEQITDGTTKSRYHEYALAYYQQLHKNLVQQKKFNAIIYAEIAFHLTHLGRLNELKNYLPGNLSSLKILAKTLYQRDKNYALAQQLYQILNDAYSGDVEVLSYLGRCSARRDQWDDTKVYFSQAVEAAEKNHEDTWYLYRDLGHLYTRYGMESDAEENFKTARMLKEKACGEGDDAGILAAEAFMLERRGDEDGACQKYEQALQLMSNHEFTITYYAQLLRKRGNVSYAEELERRMIEPTELFTMDTDISNYSDFEVVGIDDSDE